MKILSKMPQNMGIQNDHISDDISKGPFDMADPQRKSIDPNGNFSQEISQIVNGQKISPILQNGFQGTQTNKMRGFGGVMASGDSESTAKFDEEESLIAYQEMIKNINNNPQAQDMNRQLLLQQRNNASYPYHKERSSTMKEQQ